MSEVSELSRQKNHSRMKPFQNKMSHNYHSSFNASAEVGWREGEAALAGASSFFCALENTANGARDDI